jgi:hypothetical protein
MVGRVSKGDRMSSQDKIVPITNGDRRPKPGCFAVIVGKTRADIRVGPAQPVGPATVVELVNKQRQKGEPAGDVTEPVSKDSEGSSQGTEFLAKAPHAEE